MPRVVPIPTLLVALGCLALPAPAGPPVRFADDVRPLLERRCADCHGFGAAKGGFSIETREGLLAHPGAVVPGDPDASRLVALVRGDDPELVMPPKGPRLSADEVAILVGWIADGAPWDAGFAFTNELPGPRAPRSIRPRGPELPPVRDGRDHPVDRLLAAYDAEHGLAPPPLVEDAAFLRRASLDLVGVLPPRERIEAFLADARPDRRPRLVRELLADREAFAQHWLTFWNDLLRNDYEGTGYIDGGRRPITRWLYTALRDGVPYDAFVAALVDPTEASSGFADGIVWRGEANLAQSPELQFSQNVAQVFLGVNMKCASCHDSFVDGWKLADAYGLAAIYADHPLELHRCDIPTGVTARPAFPFPEIGDVDPDAPRAERLRRLAELMTSPENGRLARTVVNRLWARLMGRGLVEPVDSMDGEPWSRDLLDALAARLVDDGYALTSTIELIATSEAYQRQTVAADPGRGPFVFRGPAPRRLTAEQLLDAVWALTGGGPRVPDAAVALAPLAGSWIWSEASASAARPGGERIVLQHRLELDAVPRRADALITVDNAYRLLVNGRELAADDDWPTPEVVDLRPALRRGGNEIVLVAENQGSTPNPAGAYLEAVLVDGAGRTTTLSTGPGWRWRALWADDPGDGDPGGWKPAAVLDDQRFLGDGIDRRLRAELAGVRGASGPTVRASLVRADALMRTLGRPDRDRVVSSRPDRLTMLQALHLTNGADLAGTLHDGAARLRGQERSNADLVERVFLELLGRHPSPDERALALEMLGDDGDAGLEDLLWAVLMLPEFQLVP